MLIELKEKSKEGLLKKISPEELKQREMEKQKRMEELRKIAKAYEKSNPT